MQKETVYLNKVPFSHEDIHKVVDSFYKKVATDPLLKTPFSSVDNWPEHIEKLTHFWWLRFGGRGYMAARFNPVEKHYFAGFNREFLNHWLDLFHQTLNEKLVPDQVAVWKNLTEQMGEGLFAGNELYKKRYEAR